MAQALAIKVNTSATKYVDDYTWNVLHPYKICYRGGGINWTMDWNPINLEGHTLVRPIGLNWSLDTWPLKRIFPLNWPPGQVNIQNNWYTHIGSGFILRGIPSDLELAFRSRDCSKEYIYRLAFNQSQCSIGWYTRARTKKCIYGQGV